MTDKPLSTLPGGRGISERLPGAHLAFLTESQLRQDLFHCSGRNKEVRHILFLETAEGLASCHRFQQMAASTE